MSDTRSAFGFDQSERRETIPDLIRQLTEQGAHLAQQQANLVQAEIRSGIQDMKAAGGAMARVAAEWSRGRAHGHLAGKVHGGWAGAAGRDQTGETGFMDGAWRRAGPAFRWHGGL